MTDIRWVRGDPQGPAPPAADCVGGGRLKARQRAVRRVILWQRPAATRAPVTVLHGGFDSSKPPPWLGSVAVCVTPTLCWLLTVSGASRGGSLLFVPGNLAPLCNKNPCKPKPPARMGRGAAAGSIRRVEPGSGGGVEGCVAAVQSRGAVHRAQGDAIAGVHASEVGHGVTTEAAGVLAGVEHGINRTA